MTSLPDANQPNVCQITAQGYLLVEGIENWITQLLSIGAIDINGDVFLQMQDTKTGAIFLIRREK